ncbi:hypothetical protein [Methanoregula sp. UBA64]|uniref:hypothetical protein n=1 Tax=Methanoregula sp. UBA64 TaxID=1915554 RepID=UPI0025F41CFA|nr:hypothetical protein [Methanoregula sp. UBA64]
MCVFLLLIGCIVFAGCTDSTPSRVVSATPTTAATAPLTTTAMVQTSAATPVTPAAATGLSTYKNAQYGISLRYPSTWDVQEPDSLAMRDYGKSTINIVNFYSPGKETYAVFSVDIDPYSATDLESYYNHAVLALQSYYPHWTMTKHNPQMVVSENKAYRIDYKVEHEDSIKYDYAYQVYTIADKSPYIFTYQVQNIPPSDGTYNEYLDESQDMIKSATITPVSLTGKTR